ncbi:MAG: hypothetical protein AB2693_30440 [Candidatus Thiodiazotropha sp.]
MSSVKEMILVPKSTFERLRKLDLNQTKSPTQEKIKILETSDDTLNLEKLIATLAKSSQKKARALLGFIQERGNDTLKIDSDGTLWINGNFSGHVMDYVRYVTSRIPLKSKPENIDLFQKALQKIHVPTYLISTPTYMPGERAVKKWVAL